MNLFDNALLGYPQILPSAAPIVRWTGGSGVVYETELHPLGTTFKNLPGVYVVCSPYSPNLWSAHYVGEAVNFDNRIGSCWHSHEKSARAEADGATHICTLIVVGTDAQRRAIERDLRHGLNPPLNDQ